MNLSIYIQQILFNQLVSAVVSAAGLKYVKPTTSIGQHSRRKWFSEEEETSLLGKNKNKSTIIHKIQRWPQETKTDHDQQKIQ